ncbi:ubiquitin carboxyl-terminal hydrolase 6 [Micractinium conductrix]|uniref:Ubiquitin carboxyl-terminal hydrolase n=1 Tax=Micractinium conductrix TaxID=554055 RepID=A0A2P6VRA1_9CHLO|nr:ubiquitin carboxyl-terminal hydrolase 6 [Micractinium conductrix]|eukprot:PSC76595.1 ubiquitin carboxyl-terminal hydrolase 6 [Micractinium conductrix]
MGSVKVEVKWGKEAFKDVEIDLGQPPSVFKTQLFSLTGVPPERQKIMGVKGGLLKDDADWAKLGVKPGQKLSMMGTADKVPEAPTQQQTFMEDLPEEEQDTSGMGKYGAGLQNLGNTCYMNSTVQCLYAVPELRTSLASYSGASAMRDGNHTLTVATRNLFGSLTRSAQPVPPMEFILSLRKTYPQFGQTSREGFYMQQDAEECWTNILASLRSKLVEGPEGSGDPVIRKLFGVKLHTSLKAEEGDEAIEEDHEESKLVCNISMEVNHLSEGVALGLKADREKRSATLGRDVVFHGSQHITSLPPYLTVQMMRFYYKADVQQKAKILRKVTFPIVFDAIEFCSPELQAQLKGPRIATKELEDRKVGLAKKQKLEDGAAAGGSGAAAAPAAPAAAAPAGGGADVEMKEAGEGGGGAAAAAYADPASFSGQLTGKYELIGVLTHKGRSADSGHYVSWVKQKDGQWIQFDDDQMIPRKEEEVLTLCGGGDWHMAYMLLYRAQRVPQAEDGASGSA